MPYERAPQQVSGKVDTHVMYGTKNGNRFEGRLVNRGDGSYKGYQLGEDEWPDGINELYGES